MAARKLSEQIRPSDALACCWDVKQATINNYNLIPAIQDRRRTVNPRDTAVEGRRRRMANPIEIAGNAEEERVW